MADGAIAVVPVSVIIPCFNSGDFLRECIESLNCEVAPDEIIIIDDCSSDDTLTVAQDIERSATNVRVIARAQNGGAAAARWDGLSAARKEWVAFLDSDDFLEPGAIAEAFDVLMKSQADMCIWHLWRYDKGRQWCGMPLDQNAFPMSGRQAVINTLGSWKVHALGVCRKNVYLSSYGEVPVGLSNADELITRVVFSKIDKVAICDKKYFYRVNSNSYTKTVSKRRISYLVSVIWLMDFSKGYDAEAVDSIARNGILSALKIARNSKLFGFSDAASAIREFLNGISVRVEVGAWLRHHPTHYCAFVALNLFSFVVGAVAPKAR